MDQNPYLKAVPSCLICPQNLTGITVLPPSFGWYQACRSCVREPSLEFHLETHLPFAPFPHSSLQWLFSYVCFPLVLKESFTLIRSWGNKLDWAKHLHLLEFLKNLWCKYPYWTDEKTNIWTKWSESHLTVPNSILLCFLSLSRSNLPSIAVYFSVSISVTFSLSFSEPTPSFNCRFR